MKKPGIFSRHREIRLSDLMQLLGRASTAPRWTNGQRTLEHHRKCSPISQGQNAPASTLLKAWSPRAMSMSPSAVRLSLYCRRVWTQKVWTQILCSTNEQHCPTETLSGLRFIIPKMYSFACLKYSIS